jgi:hypothetical protein
MQRIPDPPGELLRGPTRFVDQLAVHPGGRQGAVDGLGFAQRNLEMVFTVCSAVILHREQKSCIEAEGCSSPSPPPRRAAPLSGSRYPHCCSAYPSGQRSPCTTGCCPFPCPGARESRQPGSSWSPPVSPSASPEPAPSSPHRTTLASHRPVSNLVTSGPFRISRNPMYTGHALALIGAALWAGSWWPLLVTPLCMLVTYRWVIDPEETYLTTRFGADYQRYQSQVPRWL